MLVVFDSHPIQYKAPVYQRLATYLNDELHVVYASDCSVRGYADHDFGQNLFWSPALLKGYDNTVLNCERGKPLNGFFSLGTKGLGAVFSKHRPHVCMLSQWLYLFDLAVCYHCRSHNIPLILRQETQDEAQQRNALKAAVRTLFYRSLYAHIDAFAVIGRLNANHYLAHGVPESRLFSSPYCVEDRWSVLSESVKQERRRRLRASLAASEAETIFLFSGKLTAKKGVDILLRACAHLKTKHLTEDWRLWVIGSGPEEEHLRSMAINLNLPVDFMGFKGQDSLVDYYLAADVLVVPSRRQGETWGLVVNEGLHAGCSVVMSASVGCSAEFCGWPGVSVFPEEDDCALALALRNCIPLTRDYQRYTKQMQHYSIDSAAQGILRAYRWLTEQKAGGH
jgi:glycosyltransferase involved in cell wall biosynthesis